MIRNHKLDDVWDTLVVGKSKFESIVSLRCKIVVERLLTCGGDFIAIDFCIFKPDIMLINLQRNLEPETCNKRNRSRDEMGGLLNCRTLHLPQLEAIP